MQDTRVVRMAALYSFNNLSGFLFVVILTEVSYCSLTSLQSAMVDISLWQTANGAASTQTTRLGQSELPNADQMLKVQSRANDMHAHLAKHTDVCALPFALIPINR